MKVLLQRACFIDGQRFRKSAPATHPVEIPDYLKDQLPSDAVVVGIDYKPPVVESPREPETLAELGRAMKHRSVAEELADAKIKADEELVDARIKADEDLGEEIRLERAAKAEAPPLVRGWPPEEKEVSDV